MKKESAHQLMRDIIKWADLFGSKDRPLNAGGETFWLADPSDIHVLSDDLVGVIYSKSSGKKALAIMYHINSDGGKWMAFFPTDSHLSGLSCQKLNELKMMVERHNFPINFQEQKMVVN